MSKAKKSIIEVKGTAIGIVSANESDYICLTDIARYRDAERTDYLIQNWLRNRNTIEFLGIWEQLNNAGFNPIEFDGIKKTVWSQQHVALFGQTANNGAMPVRSSKATCASTPPSNNY